MMNGKRHEEMVTLIENFIRECRLKAGERLPSERFLAEKFHASRNTVREAIKALAENGVLVSRRGAGTFLAEGAFNCMVDAVTRKKRRLREIFELRKILEPQIAMLAAKRITPEQLEELEDLIQSQDLAIKDGRDGVGLDERFHRLIVEAADNSILTHLYETLHDVLAESRVRELQSTQRNTLSLQSHRAIAKAIRAHDPEHAAASMREHMQQVEKNLEHYLGTPNHHKL